MVLFGRRRAESVCAECGAPVRHDRWDIGFKLPDCIAQAESGLMITGDADGFVRCVLEVEVTEADVPIPKAQASAPGASPTVLGHLCIGIWLALDSSIAQIVADAWDDPGRYPDLRFSGSIANEIALWPTLDSKVAEVAVRSPDELPIVVGGGADIAYVLESAWPFALVMPMVMSAT